MNRPEEQLHRAVAQYLDIVAPINGFWWAHYPSGALRNKTIGGIFKALGCRSGVPDIMIIKGGCVFWIELKSPTGRLSPAQKECRSALEEHGCAWGLARSIDEVIALLEEWDLIRRAA